MLRRLWILLIFLGAFAPGAAAPQDEVPQDEVPADAAPADADAVAAVQDSSTDDA